MHAARSGQILEVRAMLASGNVSLDARDETGTGYTAFLWACDAGHVKCIEALAEAGCDTAVRYYADSRTALMCAAICGHVEVVQAILALEGTDIEAKDAGGYTAFLWAAADNRLKCVKVLAEAGCDTAVRSDITGRSALSMCCANHGHTGLMHTLLALNGTHLEAKDNEGYTAIHLACEQGHLGCIEALVVAGCDTAATNNEGQTALMCAVFSGVKAAVQTVLDGLAGREGATWPVDVKRKKSTLERIDTGLEAKDKMGNTAFLWACRLGHTTCMDVLMKAGCNTAATTNNGGTALIVAALLDRAASAHSLLALDGIDIEAKDKDGDTAFLAACNSGSIGTIEALLQVGCDTDVRNHTGVTALMQAAASRNAAAVRAILALKSVQLEATDDVGGRTAFLYACQHANIECITALAQAGCNVAARGSDGSTALVYAQKSSHDDMREAKNSSADPPPAVCYKDVFRVIKDLQESPRRRQRLQEVDDLVNQGAFTEALRRMKQPKMESLDWTAIERTKLIALQAAAEKGHTQQFEQDERAARQHEAELMKMLEGEEKAASAGDARVAEKARKKRAKRERQRQEVRATAAAAQQASNREPEPELEPEPAPRMPRNTSIVQPAATANVSGDNAEHTPTMVHPKAHPGHAETASVLIAAEMVPNSLLAEQTSPESIVVATPVHADPRLEPVSVAAVSGSFPETLTTSTDAPCEVLLLFLMEQNMAKQWQRLRDNGVNFDALRLFVEEDLKQCGVAKGPRVKILRTRESWYEEHLHKVRSGYI